MDKTYDVFGTLVVTVIIISTLTACDRKRSQAVYVGTPQNLEVEPSGEPTKTSDKEETKNNRPIPPASNELLKLAIGATVRLTSREVDGSGVILGKDDENYLYVLTVWHAAKQDIEQVELFAITSLDAQPRLTLRGPEHFSKSEPRDLAILRVKIESGLEFESVQVVPNAHSKNIPSFAYSAGCSEGKFPTVLPERIIGCGRFRPSKSGAPNAVVSATMWTTNSPQQTGRSGGPLLDVNGRLLGIALGKEGTTGYYCHSGEIADYLLDDGPKGLVRCSKSD
jgi:S1-C subfamily serine protease